MIITSLIGDPVEHSVSNYMYNFFAGRFGLNYSHIKFRVHSEDKNNLKIAAQALRVLGIRGTNITLPYKIEIIRYLDYTDKTVAIIGAVNTIVNKNGILIGYNTDGYGAIQSIQLHLRKIKPSDRVLIFGAGGAARAIVFELCKRTENITILNRVSDFNKAQKLTTDFMKLNKKLKTLELNNRNIINELVRSNFVINATSVGMFPNNNQCLLSESLFSDINKQSLIKNKYFFDVVFNPYSTKFLSLAKNYKAKTCSGLWMMVYQGMKSFKLWTDKNVSDSDVISVHHLLKQKLYEK